MSPNPGQKSRMGWIGGVSFCADTPATTTTAKCTRAYNPTGRCNDWRLVQSRDRHLEIVFRRIILFQYESTCQAQL